jgi:RTX calcium-binding nonapeptide repeat (4 copies)
VEMCAGRVATIVGTSGPDIIPGTKYPDVIVGLGGDDTITGNSGNDIICGGPGNDRIFGGNGNDTAYGNDGDDLINGDFGADRLYGGLGTDNLIGGPSGDICDGGIGQDTGDCEGNFNVGLQVKQVQLTSFDGTLLDGALFVPANQTRKIAVLLTHGAQGRFRTGIPGWMPWWLESRRVTALALNRRDSIDYGADEGGGRTLFPDTVCDLKAGVDFLVGLGYEGVLIVGHSKGTQAAVVYPGYYKSCGADVANNPAANDPRVVGTSTFGTIHDGIKAALYLPQGASYFSNLSTAEELVTMGLGDVIYPFDTVFGVFINITPFSFLSYYGTDTLAIPEREGKKLAIPYFLGYVTGDNATPKSWSDSMNTKLKAAAVDVTYKIFPYPYPQDSSGFPAHSIDAEQVRQDAVTNLWDWLTSKVPAAGEFLDPLSLPPLPDFNPALRPVPPNPALP